MQTQQIDPDVINAGVDILTLAQQMIPTPFKRSGNVYKTLCPFHAEKTPSFVVYPESQTWRCFGACGEGGDAIALYQRLTDVSFLEACAALGGGKLAPATVERKPKAPPKPFFYADKTDVMLEWNRNLWQQRDVQLYLFNRGITIEMIQRKLLGYSEHVEGIGKGRWLTIPVWGYYAPHDDFEWVALEVRNMDSKSTKPRYMTTCYEGYGSTLYNLTTVIAHESEDVFMVENKLDAIAICAIVRRECAVAQSAGKFNAGYARQLSQFRRLIDLSDGDEAGHRQAERIKALVNPSAYERRWWEWYKDVGDMIQDEVQHAIIELHELLDLIPDVDLVLDEAEFRLGSVVYVESE